jgi:hypothetical protein
LIREIVDTQACAVVIEGFGIEIFSVEFYPVQRQILAIKKQRGRGGSARRSFEFQSAVYAGAFRIQVDIEDNLFNQPWRRSICMAVYLFRAGGLCAHIKSLE